ncbi:hypothetical protein [uncultured Bradyrhizobium sp.]|jgi:hypothetical protein|uniref:hypothetical protein n=1 Tax=uncultured Bradyrhizobium sp. TaxID=199684 RepID=UPI00260B5C0E|nr:hypothetical protein [uncultured Bradyrhizobium sp.]
MRAATASRLYAIGLPGFLVLSSGPAHPNPTFLCPIVSAGLEDDTLYTFDRQTQTMTAVSSTSEFEGPLRKSTTLYFVIKTGGDDRAGAIVIKTARLGPQLAADRPDYGRVLLRRSTAGSNCGSRRPYLNSVSAIAYQAYHDLGYDRGEILESLDGGITGLDNLKRFHVGYDATDYASPNQKCRRTDDPKRYDGGYEARNNRSQFSFVPDIVDHGISGVTSQAVSGSFRWVASLIVSPASAKRENLRERRVEIKTYQTVAGVACIPVTLNVRGAAQVIRVNDLDRRKLFGSDFGRVKEFRLGPITGGEP